MMHVAFSIKPKILLKAENCMEFFLESLLGKSRIKEIFLIRTIQPTKENQMEQKFLAKNFFQNLAIPSEVVLFSKKKGCCTHIWRTKIFGPMESAQEFSVSLATIGYSGSSVLLCFLIKGHKR